MNENEMVCRFCLKIPDSKPKTVDEVTKRIFDVLQIQVNFDVFDGLSMCKNCSKTIKRLLTFKSVYVTVEQMLLECILRENKTTIDLKDVYNAEKVDSILERDADICRLCLKWCEARDLILISTLLNDAVSLEMWTENMTEVDLTITKYPKVCIDCKNCIQRYSKFVWNLRSVEERIDSNRYTKPRNDRSQPKIYKCDKCSYETQRKDRLNQHTKTHQDRSQLTMHKCPTCSYETHRKYHLNQHIKTHQNRNQLKMYKCLKCSYETHRKNSLNKHAKTHQDRSELKMYKCLKCSYEAYRNDYLIIHTKTHHDKSQLKMYKCFVCSYETHKNSTMKRHVGTHEDKRQFQMYECLYCSYKTHRKDSFNQHTKTHQDQRQLKMYKCPTCSYETHTKSYLNKHTKVHLDRSQLEMYKCLKEM